MKLSSAHSEKRGLFGYIRNPVTGQLIEFIFPPGVRKLAFEVFLGETTHDVDLVLKDREGMSPDDPFDREVELVAPARRGVVVQNRAEPKTAPVLTAPSAALGPDGHELKPGGEIADGPVVKTRELCDPDGTFAPDKDTPSSNPYVASTTPHLVERGVLEPVTPSEKALEKTPEVPARDLVAVSTDEPSSAPRGTGLVSVAVDEVPVEFTEGESEIVSIDDVEPKAPNTELVSVAAEEPKVAFPGDTPSGASETPSAPTPVQGSTPKKQRNR